MPLKTIKVFISFLFILTISTTVFTQDKPESITLAELKSNTPDTPTTAEIMRNRISKAKAFLVVKNYSAAIYELENIKRESNDQTVHRVLNVLLMHAYLEQGEYTKAQKFLKELHSAKNSDAALDYLAIAGQVVSGAKTMNERYKSLGLSVSDTNLPKEATNDVENMRKTLELVVDQAKTLSQNKQYSSNVYALLEETSSIRGNLAKDAYDQKRWQNEVADARELIVNPNSKIINATRTTITAPTTEIVATTDVTNTEDSSDDILETDDDTDEVETSIFKPVEEEKTQPKEQPKTNQPTKLPTENTVAKINPDKNEIKDGTFPTDKKVIIIPSAEKNNDEMVDSTENKNQPNVKSTIQDKPKTEDKKPIENNVAKNEDKPIENKSNDNSILDIGSLIGYATKRVNPVYPTQAKSMRMTGTVKVEIVIDEEGKVTEVANTEGPSLLKRAATDAVKKWQFTPFMRDGQPVKATGYVSFNFNL